MSSSRFENFDSFLEYLDTLGLFHMDLGLQRVSSALEILGVSHASDVSIQVVGTNGKGSTSTFLAQVLTTSGFKTGLYTSPHFLSPRERILVDGRELSEAAWLEAAEDVLRISEDRSPDLRLTYFELLTVIAAWLFRENGCAVAVFEAGLGGAHDATTALRHDLTVITPIGLDHISILGPTLADIARDKAHAMRPGVPAVTADQNLDVMAVLKTVAAKTEAPLHCARDIAAGHGVAWPSESAMPGPHQTENLNLALAAYQLLAQTHGLPVDAQALNLAARQAFIPGRLQIIPPSTGWPSFILDGAHNLPGLECLVRALNHLTIKPQAVIFACLGDKDIDAMLPLVRSLTDGTIIVPGIDAPGRALDPAVLAGRIGDRAAPVRGMPEALRLVKGSDGAVLVCGSLYLLAEVYKLRPQWLKRR